MICKKCGIALGISNGNIWYADGSISGRYPPYIKGTFFDVDEIKYLFKAISGYLGHDIDNIIAGGKYHDTKEYMTSMIRRLKETPGGVLPTDEKLFQMMLYPVRIWGIADARIISVRPEKKVIEVKDPYSIPLFCGDVAAVAGVVEGVEMKAEWEGSDEEGVITVVPSGAYSSVERRVEKELAKGSEYDGDELECERCEVCGAPRAVSEIFEWDVERCRIIERSTGRRYCFNNTNGVVAVLKLLVSELGDELEQKMVDIARDYSRELYSDVKSEFDLEEELGSFPFRGWGVAEETISGEGEDAILVENPFCEILVAGRIWGMKETDRGSPLRAARSVTGGGSLELVFNPS